MFTGKKKAACAAMLSMAMVAPLAAFAENETRVITCGTLNLRAEESASSKILGKYGWGSEVLVKGINGDWASVDVGGQSGYMYAKYLGREGTTNSTAYVKTNNRGLNLRAEPNGNILGSYPRGTKVTVPPPANGARSAWMARPAICRAAGSPARPSAAAPPPSLRLSARPWSTTRATRRCSSCVARPT